MEIPAVMRIVIVITPTHASASLIIRIPACNTVEKQAWR